MFDMTGVAKTREGGTVDYDLYALAKLLGYSQPRRAIQDFTRRMKVTSEPETGAPFDPSNASEALLRLFAMYTKAPRAEEFQRWVLCELIEAPMRQQEERLTHAKCVNYLLSNIGTCTLDDVYARFPTGIADRAIKETPEAYRLLGFVPPSEVGIGVDKVYRILDALNVFKDDGYPHPEFAEDLIEVARYNGNGGRKVWFALGPKLVEKVLANKALAAPVGLVLQSDSYSENFEVGPESRPSLPVRKDRYTRVAQK